MRDYLKKMLILAFFGLFSWVIVTYQPGIIIGLIFLLFFLCYFSDKAYKMSIRAFNFPEHSFLGGFLGFLSVFWILTVVCGIMVFFQIPPVVFGTLVLPVTGLSVYIFSKLIFWQKDIHHENIIAEEEEFVLPSSTSLIGGAGILMLSGFYILYKHQTGDEILTPWSVLPNYYIYLYLVVYLFLGFLIFTNRHAKTILIFLSVFAALCHFNLGLTHQLVYGADYWRHLGVENQLLQTGKLNITNFSADPNFFEKLNPGIYSYAQFWGINVFLNLFTGISLLDLGRFVGPLLWAVFIPTLIYALGRLMLWNKRTVLFLSWVSFVPSALLVSGSFFLPVSFHFIFWLLSMLFLFKADLRKNIKQLWGLLFVGLVLSTGYLLYAFIFFGALILKTINVYLRQGNLIENVLWSIFTLLTGVSFPILEILSGYSQLSFKSGIFSAVKQFVGNLSGYYFVFGPRPHTIATGNILVNQTPDYAFVSNALTVLPGWMFIISILFIGLSIYGVYKFFNKETDKRWFSVLFIGLFIGYFLSRYLLSGDNILTRRLDAILALGLIVFFVYTVKDWMSQNYGYRVTVGIVVLLSLFGTAIYSLGPVSKVVSAQEYLDYQNIFAQLKDENKYCVIADPYNLTALEGVSAKQIVGGGFPIKGDFSQPELQYILKSLQEGKDKMQIIVQAKQITGAKNCFVLEKNENGVKMIKY